MDGICKEIERWNQLHLKLKFAVTEPTNQPGWGQHEPQHITSRVELALPCLVKNQEQNEVRAWGTASDWYDAHGRIAFRPATQIANRSARAS